MKFVRENPCTESFRGQSCVNRAGKFGQCSVLLPQPHQALPNMSGTGRLDDVAFISLLRSGQWFIFPPLC